MTRAQRAAAGGVNPSLPPTGTPPSTTVDAPSVDAPSLPSESLGISPDSGYSEAEEKLYRDSLAASVQDLEVSQLADFDEQSRLALEESTMNERIHHLQLAAIRQRVIIKAKQLAALEAQAEANRRIVEGLDPVPMVGLPSVVTVAPVVVPVVPTPAEVTTPARYNLRPRMLAFQSTVGRKAPSAASVVY